MPTGEVALAGLRQASARHADGYHQRLAADLVAMLPHDRDEARRILAYVEAILNLELPPPSEG
jgi:hypothetical protein